MPEQLQQKFISVAAPVEQGILADQTCTAKTYHSNATSAVVSTIRCVRRSEMDILQATQM
jgi:hypothetical protein